MRKHISNGIYLLTLSSIGVILIALLLVAIGLLNSIGIIHLELNEKIIFHVMGSFAAGFLGLVLAYLFKVFNDFLGDHSEL